jgi:hypothetical protein
VRALFLAEVPLIDAKSAKESVTFTTSEGVLNDMLAD